MKHSDAHSDEHPWRDAALEAEFATGQHEETEQVARAHIAIRLARMSFGGVVCLLGIIAMVGPGPGLLVLALGLTILARDVAWADRLLQRVRDRLPSDDDGKLPRSTIVTMSVVTLAAIAGSAWWFLAR